MTLRGLHLLLTYQCNLECDHCFVWGSPWQAGTMTLQGISQEQYADACHLCFDARRALVGRFPEILAPDQMYGVAGGGT